MMLTWSSPLEQFDAVTAATTAHGKEELKQVFLFLKSYPKGEYAQLKQLNQYNTAVFKKIR